MKEFQEIVEKIKTENASLADSEYYLRKYFEDMPSDELKSKYEKAYEYLDILVGLISSENRKETENDRQKFLAFCSKNEIFV